MSIEERVARLEQAFVNLKEGIDDIRNNHLNSIYDKLNDIALKLNSPRPSWGITIAISALLSLCVGLIVAFAMMK